MSDPQQQVARLVMQQPRQNVPPVSHSAASHQHNAAPQADQAFGACFKCGLPDHMAENYPTRQLNQGANP
jgi:hypothetical protein